MRRHILMRFALIRAVCWPSLLGVAALFLRTVGVSRQEGRGGHISNGWGREGLLLSAIRQGPIKLFSTTQNSFQQDAHFNLQPLLCFPFIRLGQAPERRSELRAGATQRPGRLVLGSLGMHLPPFHPPQPSLTLFASTGTWEIMMFCGCSKSLSWLIKVWQERELGWLSRRWCWEFEEGRQV